MTTKRLLTSFLMATAFAIAATSAYANHDAVQFGSNIDVPRDGSVHDAVCFFCSVNAEGTVDGNIVVFFGNVHIAGAAKHDVVNFFGRITADNDASVGNDMVSMFGGIRLGDNVSVGKDLVAMFGSLRAPASVTVGGDRVVQPGWVFWGPLLFIGLFVVLVVREIRMHRRRSLLQSYSIPPRP